MDRDTRPPVDENLLLGRYDFGFPHPLFMAYLAKLKHPAKEHAKFHPDYHHWLVQTSRGEECWEIASTDQWCTINPPKEKDREQSKEAYISSQSQCHHSEEEGNDGCQGYEILE